MVMVMVMNLGSMRRVTSGLPNPACPTLSARTLFMIIIFGSGDDLRDDTYEKQLDGFDDMGKLDEINEWIGWERWFGWIGGLDRLDVLDELAERKGRSVFLKQPPPLSKLDEEFAEF